MILRDKKYTSIIILLCTALVAIIHITATSYGWYLSIWWFDIPMHIAGGIVTSLIIHYLSSVRNGDLEKKIHYSLYILFLIATTGLVGITWEWYEYFIDIIITHRWTIDTIPGYVHADTLADLGNDLIGATLVSAILTLKNYKIATAAKRSPVSTFINRTP